MYYIIFYYDRSLKIEAATKKEYDQAYQRVQDYIVENCLNKQKINDPSRIVTPMMSTLIQQINHYCSGSISVDTFYHELFTKYFPHSLQLSERNIWSHFKHFLALIPEPERQVTLHLRYLRWRPRIWTPCCNKEHCFRCRTRDFHEGRSCIENTEVLDHSIVDCPGCGLYLCKGDGCNNVTCPCGKQFSWTAEKETIDRAQQFALAYPRYTSICCAYIILDRDPSSYLQQLVGDTATTSSSKSTPTSDSSSTITTAAANSISNPTVTVVSSLDSNPTDMNTTATSSSLPLQVSAHMVIDTTATTTATSSLGNNTFTPSQSTTTSPHNNNTYMNAYYASNYMYNDTTAVANTNTSINNITVSESSSPTSTSTSSHTPTNSTTSTNASNNTNNESIMTDENRNTLILNANAWQQVNKCILHDIYL